MTRSARGVGDPPARVRLVRSGPVGALISDIDPRQPLGRPADLIAHQQLLDATAVRTPVLPMRFGAVLADARTVEDELLAPSAGDFAAALDELEDRIQFVIKGRYAEELLLRDVLARHAEAARLREEITAAGDPGAARAASIRLGEIVSAAISDQQAADTAILTDAIAPHCAATSVRPPTHELDAVHVAVLADRDQRRDLEEVLDSLNRMWAGRVGLRLLGPMAPYDFVITMTAGTER